MTLEKICKYVFLKVVCQSKKCLEFSLPSCHQYIQNNLLWPFLLLDENIFLVSAFFIRIPLRFLKNSAAVCFPDIILRLKHLPKIKCSKMKQRAQITLSCMLQLFLVRILFEKQMAAELLTNSKAIQLLRPEFFNNFHKNYVRIT